MHFLHLGQRNLPDFILKFKCQSSKVKMESSEGRRVCPVMNQKPGGESNWYNRSKMTVFELPDLNMSQESGCLKIEHLAVKNTEIEGVFFIRRKKWRHTCSHISQKRPLFLINFPDQRQQHSELIHNARLNNVQNLSLRYRIYLMPTCAIKQFGKKSP